VLALRTDVEQLSQAFWETCFENSYLKCHGEAFQELFQTIMERRYPGDFQRVVPWGRAGDLKNDGYLASRRQLFQCYGPKVLDLRATLDKVNDDYAGAVEHWAVNFDEWIFVHNGQSGLPPQVAQRLLDLTVQDPAHAARPWGFADLRNEAMQLSAMDLAVVFGDAPTMHTMLHLGFDDLQPLVAEITLRAEAPLNPSLAEVPAEKLQANMFSQPVQEMMKSGFVRTKLVNEYFTTHPEPRHQDRIAAWFREQYVRLRSEATTADQVYNRMRDLVGGVGPHNARRECAVLTIVAFFFETCDIFEPHGHLPYAPTN